MDLQPNESIQSNSNSFPTVDYTGPIHFVIDDYQNRKGSVSQIQRCLALYNVMVGRTDRNPFELKH